MGKEQFEPPITPGEVARARARELRDIASRTLDMPDGRRIIVQSENDNEVIVMEVSPKDERSMRAISRDDFNALTDEFEAAYKASETQAPLVGPSEAEEPSAGGRLSTTFADGTSTTYVSKAEAGAQTPAEQQAEAEESDTVTVEEPAKRVEKVPVTTDDQAKPGEPVPVRKLDDRYEKPTGPEADEIQTEMNALTAQITDAGVAIGKARSEGRDADVQKLTAERQQLLDDKSALRIRERALLASQRSETKKGFDPDEEADRIMAEIKAKGDELEAARRAAKEEKYPKIKVEDVPAADDDELTAIIAKGDAAAGQKIDDQPVDEPGAVESTPPVPPVEEKLEEGAEAEVPAPETLQEKWMKLVAQYGRVTDRYSPEGRRLRKEVDAAYDAMHTPEKSTVDSLHDEWMRLASEHAQLNPKSPEAEALYAKVEEAYEKLRMAEAQLEASEAAQEPGGGQQTSPEGAPGAPSTGEGVGENDTEAEASPEQRASELLEETRDRYAKLTAGDRLSYMGRFLKSNGLLSRALRKVPGVSWLVDKLNNSSRAQVVQEARAEYEEALRSIESLALTSAEAENMTAEQMQQARVQLQIREEHALTMSVHDHQMASGKERNKFTDWWVRHNGIGGKIMKAGVIVGASVVTGGAAGAIMAGAFGLVAATGIAGAGVGALTGGGIAKAVTNRRARSFIDKERTRTVAEREMRQDRARISTELSQPAAEAGEGQQAASEAPDWTRRVTDVIEARTDEIVKGNRIRMKTAIGLGAAAGGAAGNFVGSWIDNALNAPQVNAQPNEGTPPHDRYPDNVPEVELKGQEFHVESGNGVIEEIQQAAHANGHDISMGRAEEIYNSIYENMGDKIIHGGPEYHGSAGDIRFGESGTYAWGKGVLKTIISMAAK